MVRRNSLTPNIKAAKNIKMVAAFIALVTMVGIARIIGFVMKNNAIADKVTAINTTSNGLPLIAQRLMSAENASAAALTLISDMRITPL